MNKSYKYKFQVNIPIVPRTVGRRRTCLGDANPKARPRSVILRTLPTRIILSGLISACTLNKSKNKYRNL